MYSTTQAWARGHARAPPAQSRSMVRCDQQSFSSDGPLGVERRRATRRAVAADEPLAHAKLRTGGQLVALEASSWGALTETTERLLPGRHLDVHIVTHGVRTLVRSRMARAYVCRLQPDAIHYRAALAFDHPIDASACGNARLSVLAPSPGAPHQAHSHSADIVFSERFIASNG